MMVLHNISPQHTYFSGKGKACLAEIQKFAAKHN